MADHIIVQIRDALVSAMEAGIPAATIIAGRPQDYELQDVELPAIWISLGSESLSEDDLGGGIEWIEHAMSVACAVKITGDCEMAVANLARDVRHVIAANRLAGGAKWISYSGASLPAVDGTGERPRGRWDLEFSVRYATAPESVDASL